MVGVDVAEGAREQLVLRPDLLGELRAVPLELRRRRLLHRLRRRRLLDLRRVLGVKVAHAAVVVVGDVGEVDDVLRLDELGKLVVRDAAVAVGVELRHQLVDDFLHVRRVHVERLEHVEDLDLCQLLVLVDVHLAGPRAWSLRELRGLRHELRHELRTNCARIAPDCARTLRNASWSVL